MSGRLILTLSAGVLFVCGGAGLFAADEVGRILAPAPSPTIPVVVQLAASGLLGFSMLNWMSRGSRIGGIYPRPIGLANLLLFTTTALTLGKAVAAETLLASAAGLGVIFSTLAVSFAWLLFGHDPLSGNPAKTRHWHLPTTLLGAITRHADTSHSTSRTMPTSTSTTWRPFTSRRAGRPIAPMCWRRRRRHGTAVCQD